MLGGLFSGKKTKYAADPLAGDINAAGKTGIDYLKGGADKLNTLYNEDPSKLVNNQIGMENKLLRGASEDAGRRTRELLARRGMGNSSIGIGQEANQARTLSERLAMNSASGMQRLRDMSLQNAQGQMQAGQGLFNLKASQGPIQMQDVTREGPSMFDKLAPLLNGAASGIGAFYGARK